MIKINSEVPNIDLKAYDPVKDEEVKINLSTSFRDKWLAIIFYPADFTFVCPTELEEAAKHHDKIKKLGAEVVSVSTDKVETHKAWHDSSPAIKKVKYKMIADPTGILSRRFGVYIEEEGVALRGTFLIDPKGMIKTMEIHDNSIGRSTDELIRKLHAAIFVSKHKGLVCPANWHPGENTLKKGMDLVGKL